MMRYAIAVALVLAVALLAASLLAAGCKDSESPAQKTPSPSTPTAAQPEPVGPVPEGVLLVKRQGAPDTTFGIGSDGGVAERRKGFNYLVSPDGEHAAFLRGASADRASEVVMLNAGGKEMFAHRGAQPGRDSTYPQVLWSPDGHRLAYTLPDEAVPSTNHVYTVSAESGGRRQLSENAGSYSLIGWTADGRLLVQENATLALMGGKSEPLALPDGLPALGEVQISQDGRFVAFTVGNLGEARQLWLLDIDSGDSRLLAEMGQLARRPADGRYVSAAPPAAPLPDAATAMLKGPPPVAWSPDGKRIAYYTTEMIESNTLTSELRVVNVETGEDVSVTNEGGWAAAWSPDGRYLAESAGKRGGVVIMGPGNDVRTLDVQAFRLLWSAGGKLAAVGDGSVSLVDPETGDAQEARTPEGTAVAGARGWGTIWSPSGRYLAVVTGEDEALRNGSLFIVDTGTAEATLVLDKGSFFPVAWLRT